MRARGFTLLEVLLVVAVLGMVALVVLPDWGGFEQNQRLMESSQRLRGLVARCRAEAMNESLEYRLDFKLDGTLRVVRQRDPILAPHEYELVENGWAMTEILLAGVWVEAVQPLPAGPPPILIEDDYIEFEEAYEEVEPTPIEEFDDTVSVTFSPDGSSESLRWVLRDRRGLGLEMTLDGRLGKVDVITVESIPEDDAYQPEPLDAEEDDDFRFDDELDDY